MSESNGKAKASLHDLDISEISMTDESQGFAASGMETILYKNRETCKEDLTKEQLALLEKYGEEFTPLQKQLSDTKAPSSVKSDAGEDNLTKGNKMSEEKDLLIEKQQKQIEALLEKEAKKDVKESLAAYNLTDVDKVVAVLVGLSEDDVGVITKEFKALVDKEVELTKNAEKLADIEKEAGSEGEAEAPVEKSSNELIREAAIKIQKGELV